MLNKNGRFGEGPSVVTSCWVQQLGQDRDGRAGVAKALGKEGYQSF